MCLNCCTSVNSVCASVDAQTIHVRTCIRGQLSLVANITERLGEILYDGWMMIILIQETFGTLPLGATGISGYHNNIHT